jgi:hypothetical protein
VPRCTLSRQHHIVHSAAVYNELMSNVANA